MMAGSGSNMTEPGSVTATSTGPDVDANEEMPAIDSEIEEALEEGINIEYLAAPKEIIRDDEGKVRGMVVQRMELGEPDDSGRRRPVPIEGDVYDMEADSVIMAVSQAPDWSTLGGGIEVKGNWLEVDEWGRTGIDGVWSGGDTLTLGLATISIASITCSRTNASPSPRVPTLLPSTCSLSAMK